MDQGTILMIVVVIALAGMMWWQSRNAKKRQAQVRDFRQSLEPGELVVSIGGVIGKVVSVDTKYEEIVIDSDGSLLRFTFNAISKRYERPAFVDDEDTAEKTPDHAVQPVSDDDTQADDVAPTSVTSVSASSSETADETSTSAGAFATTANSSAAQIPVDAGLDDMSDKDSPARQ